MKSLSKLKLPELKELLSKTFYVRGYSRSRKAEVLEALTYRIKNTLRISRLRAVCEKLGVELSPEVSKRECLNIIFPGEYTMWYEKNYDYVRKEWYTANKKTDYVMKTTLTRSDRPRVKVGVKNIAVKLLQEHRLDEVRPPVYYSAYPYVFVDYYVMDWSLWRVKTMKDQSRFVPLSDVVDAQTLNNMFRSEFGSYTARLDRVQRFYQLQEEAPKQEAKKALDEEAKREMRAKSNSSFLAAIGKKSSKIFEKLKTKDLLKSLGPNVVDFDPNGDMIRYNNPRIRFENIAGYHNPYEMYSNTLGSDGTITIRGADITGTTISTDQTPDVTDNEDL